MNGWAGICRLGGIGDNLIASSACRPLKALGYKVEFIASAPHHLVLKNNPFIDKLSIKNSDRDLPQGDMDKWQAWFESRSHEYEVFAHLSHSCEGRHSLFSNMTSFWWPPEYRRKLCAGSYLETAMDIVGVPHMFGPLYFPTEEEKERAQETKKKMGDKVIAWILSGTRIDKVYPYAPHAIPRLIKETGLSIVMIGAGPKQFSMAKLIQDDIKRTNSSDDGLHLALSPDNAEEIREYGKVWDVRRSLALMLACDLVITPDTGFAWAAAFEAMPKILLLSHASVENITKHWVNTTTLHANPDNVPCWPCHRLHNGPETCVVSKDGNGAACISDISVESLIQAAHACLN